MLSFGQLVDQGFKNRPRPRLVGHMAAQFTGQSGP